LKIKKKGGFIMSNNSPNQEVVRILVFVGGKLGSEDHKFLEDYVETVFRARSKLNTMNNHFSFLKKIDRPTHDDIIDFYKQSFMKIDADYDGITSDEVFREIVCQCENFVDFVKLRPDSFKEKLLIYLFNQ
jgi:hypothetical protein